MQEPVWAPYHSFSICTGECVRDGRLKKYNQKDFQRKTFTIQYIKWDMKAKDQLVHCCNSLVVFLHKTAQIRAGSQE